MEVSRKQMELATALVTAAAGGLICYGSLENGIRWGSGGPDPGYFPFAIGCLIIIGSLAICAQTLWVHRRESLASAAAARVAQDPPNPLVHHDAVFIDGARLKQVMLFAIPLGIMSALSSWLGLYIGMGAYILYAMRFSAGMSWMKSAITACIVIIVNFIVFENLFMVPLFKGPVLEYFGIY